MERPFEPTIRTMRVMRAAPLAAALLVCACSARTRRFASYQFAGKAPSVACRQDGPARWCRYEPPGPVAPGELVYFLHYATGDERSFGRLGLGRAFYDEYRRLGKPAPRVVTVSYGPHWLVAGDPGLRQTVTREEFAALRARIEADLGPVTRRSVWGMSMGGYNAAAAALAAPGEWSAVALSCPALEAVSPWAPDAPRVPARAQEGRELFTHRLAGEREWRADEPAGRASAAAPPFLIEWNADDEFGFQDGARALARALAASGRAPQTRESPGGHCAIDARLVARFLAGSGSAAGGAGKAAAAGAR